MKTKILNALATLCLTFFLQTTNSNSQCICPNTPSDIILNSGSSWTVTIDNGGEDIAWDVTAIDDEDDDLIKDDGYVAVGSSDMGGTNGIDAFVVRFNTDGSTTSPGWIHNYNGSDNNYDVAYAVEQTTKGDLIICGSTKTDNLNPNKPKNNNVWVLKLDIYGNEVPGWIGGKEYGGGTSGNYVSNDVGYGY
ncbi:MAG: hypothetical protein LH473_13225 [Chitinophagales bacterium]|nr:hypothetical protein [Chitinophagales bacterium]